MGSYDIQTLSMARSAALALAGSGMGAEDARAELVRRGLDAPLVEIAIGIAATEQRARAQRSLTAGLVLGGLVSAVALLGLVATAASPARGAVAGPLLTALGSGGAVMLGSLVRRLLRPGWPLAPGALAGLGVSLAELRGDDEVLAEAAALHQRRRRAEIIAAIAAIALVAFGALLVLPATGGFGDMAFFGLAAVAVFVYFVLRQVLIGAEGMSAPAGPPRAPAPAASAKAPAKASGRDHAVPRLPAIPLPREADIPHAPLLRPGALSVDIRETGQAAHAGLLVFTTLGLAYLPDMQNQLLAAANLIVPRVVSYAVPEGVAQLLAFIDELSGPGLTPQAWARRASADPRHVVIPWPELVRVRHVPADLCWIVTRQLPDGSGRDLRLELVADEDLALLLFAARLRFECDAAVYARLLGPERIRIAAEEQAKAADYYGADIVHHAADIEARIDRRLAAWLETRRPDVAAAIRAELGPALAAYATIPGLRALHPELFGDDTSS